MTIYKVSADHGAVKDFKTLPEAKKYGEKLARQNAWKGRYNVGVRYVSITVQIAPGHGIEMWYIPYPVRGTGIKAEKLLELMKKHGEPAFKWIRNENFKRAVIRFKMGTRNFDEKYGKVNGHLQFEQDFGKKKIRVR